MTAICILAAVGVALDAPARRNAFSLIISFPIVCLMVPALMRFAPG